jgi:hypothetical protein
VLPGGIVQSMVGENAVWLPFFLQINISAFARTFQVVISMLFFVISLEQVLDILS